MDNQTKQLIELLILFVSGGGLGGIFAGWVVRSFTSYFDHKRESALKRDDLLQQQGLKRITELEEKSEKYDKTFVEFEDKIAQLERKIEDLLKRNRSLIFENERLIIENRELRQERDDLVVRLKECEEKRNEGSIHNRAGTSAGAGGI